MSERGKFNNLIMTVSICLNIALTVMLIVLLGQGSDNKSTETEVDITGETGRSDHEFVQSKDDNIYVMEPEGFGILLDGAEVTSTSQTTAASTADTTTTAVTTTDTRIVHTLATAAPQKENDEDSGEWLDLWNVTP